MKRSDGFWFLETIEKDIAIDTGDSYGEMFDTLFLERTVVL